MILCVCMCIFFKALTTEYSVVLSFLFPFLACFFYQICPVFICYSKHPCVVVCGNNFEPLQYSNKIPKYQNVKIPRGKEGYRPFLT